MLIEEEITLNLSVAHPSNDTDAAGGAISDPRALVTNATVGEILPRLQADPDGELDTDMVEQFQISYVENLNEEDAWGSPGGWVANLLGPMTGTTQITYTPSNAGDGATKFVRTWGVVSGAVTHEDTTLAGLTPVTTAASFSRVFRPEIRAVSNGQLVPAAADIDVAQTGGSSLGKITAGYSMATSEIEIAVAAAVGDVDPLDDRTTAPAGVTFSAPRTEAGKLAFPADLGPEERLAIYWHQEAQPGVGSVALDIDFRMVGDN